MRGGLAMILQLSVSFLRTMKCSTPPIHLPCPSSLHRSGESDLARKSNQLRAAQVSVASLGEKIKDLKHRINAKEAYVEGKAREPHICMQTANIYRSLVCV